jgi:hypothetical protein
MAFPPKSSFPTAAPAMPKMASATKPSFAKPPTVARSTGNFFNTVKGVPPHKAHLSGPGRGKF